MNNSQLLISREALLHNVQLIRRALKPATRLCAVIKADAYGHGASIVADTLCNFSLDDMDGPAVDALAVATIEEAAALPATDLPISILRPVENVFFDQNRESLELAIRNGWMLTLISPTAADDMARVAMSLGKRAVVQIMIDTGLSRCGAPIDSLDELLKKLESRSALRLTALATHFACADVPGDTFTREQLRRFSDATDAFVAARPGRIIRHAANSGGIFYWPDSHLDMVRSGISIYGMDPTCRPNLNRTLRPAMTWTAPLLAVRDVPRGGSAGYGQTWTADRDTRIGLVGVGYADGYLRAFSNRARVLVGGRTVPVVGRVSMDYITIDLGPDSQDRLADPVTLLDNDPLSPASAYALASLADTIPYELFTRIGGRTRRDVFCSNTHPASPVFQGAKARPTETGELPQLDRE